MKGVAPSADSAASRFGQAVVRCYEAGKQTSVRFRFGYLSSKVVVYGHCLCDFAPHN